MIKDFRIALYLFVIFMISSAHADSYVDFFRAINVDDSGTVRELLARGFDPNAVNEKGQGALFLAVREGSPRVFEALLADPKLSVDAANASDETPLMMAALRGQLELAGRLLDRGAKVNRPGWTPLHYAAAGPEPRMVGLLLDRGAEVQAPSPNQSTPLMMAARYGDERSVDLLLAHHADARSRNALGLNAADFARLGGRETLAARLDAMAR